MENTCGLNVIDNYIYCIEKDEKEGQNNLIKWKQMARKRSSCTRCWCKPSYSNGKMGILF